MTKNGRIAGGIILLVGSAFCFYLAFLFYTEVIGPLWSIVPSIFFAAGVCGAVGGILLLIDMTAGGILAIVAGSLALIAYFFAIPELSTFGGRALLTWLIPMTLQLAGGILGIAVGKEF